MNFSQTLNTERKPYKTRLVNFWIVKQIFRIGILKFTFYKDIRSSIKVKIMKDGHLYELRFKHSIYLLLKESEVNIMFKKCVPEKFALCKVIMQGKLF